jgi:hypothetical protein
LKKRIAEQRTFVGSAKIGSEIKIVARDRYELKRIYDELNELLERAAKRLRKNNNN